MKINVQIIPKNQEEVVNFEVHQVTNAISKSMELLTTSSPDTMEPLKTPTYLLGKIDQTYYKISFKDIFYLESIERKVFIYTEKKNYEIDEKLYVLEEMLSNFDFARVSKSMILNINKIYSFAPMFSGNLEALLLNKEKVSISRRYVADLKKQMGMRDRT